MNEWKQYKSSNHLGIPDLCCSPVPQVSRWSQYRRDTEPGGGLHFFVDDYRFNVLYNQPEKGLKIVKKYDVVIEPDYSCYIDRPYVETIWSTYRARWCAAYWQAHGVLVVPSLNWSTMESLDVTTLGIPRGGCVAVCARGAQRMPESFARCLQRAMDIVEPAHVIIFATTQFQVDLCSATLHGVESSAVMMEYKQRTKGE